jgi:hypothetical protein
MAGNIMQLNGKPPSATWLGLPKDKLQDHPATHEKSSSFAIIFIRNLVAGSTFLLACQSPVVHQEGATTRTATNGHQCSRCLLSPFLQQLQQLHSIKPSLLPQVRCRMDQGNNMSSKGLHLQLETLASAAE